MEKFLMTNSNHKSEMLADIVNAFSEYADRPALIIDDTTYSYAELYEKVVSILPLLEGTHDSSVGIVAENTLSTYAAILAVLLSGNTYVVLHPDFPTRATVPSSQRLASEWCSMSAVWGPGGNPPTVSGP